ncbi:MAG: hypothetical protein HUJ62_03295 [Streptococcus gallolyticus]|nr:hypothetical protein [Streptococcus gallolyticus]
MKVKEEKTKIHVSGSQKKVGVACPSTAECQRKILDFCSMEIYSSVKEDNHEAFVGKWMQIVIKLLGEMVPTHIGEHHFVSLV